MAKAKEQTLGDRLDKLKSIHDQRNGLYKDAAFRRGEIMLALFDGEMPDLKTEEDVNRYGIFQMIVSKLTRYAVTFENGGHEDSLDDLAVYSQMLAQYDNKIKGNKK